MFRRPFLRRRRLLGAAIVGGLGYLVGRRRASTAAVEAEAVNEGVSDRLDELDSLRDNGEITEAEYAARRKELLGQL